jgi:hypothetical protein
MAAYNALSQGKNVEFLNYLNKAIDFAKANDLSDLAIKFMIKRNSHRLRTDPTGEVLEEVSSKSLPEIKDIMRKIYYKSKDIDLLVDVMRFEAEIYIKKGNLTPKSLLLLSAGEELLLDARKITTGMLPKRKVTKSEPENWAEFLSTEEVIRVNRIKEWDVLMDLAGVYESKAKFYESGGNIDKVQEQIDKAKAKLQEAIKISDELGFKSLKLQALQAISLLLTKPEDSEERLKVKQEIEMLLNDA